MNVQISSAPMQVLNHARPMVVRDEWEEALARQDRAALAAMDVVEDLSEALFDDWDFNYVVEFFGLHLVEVVRARVNSGWVETPLEAAMLERVAEYADDIGGLRDGLEDQSTRAALEELAKAARRAAHLIRLDSTRPDTAPF
jgi:hypothetical protein